MGISPARSLSFSDGALSMSMISIQSRRVCCMCVACGNIVCDAMLNAMQCIPCVSFNQAASGLSSELCNVQLPILLLPQAVAKAGP